jgi:alpha-L-arabinofuranosidase
MTAANVVQSITGVVKVTVEADKTRNFMAPRAPGIEASVSDNTLMDPALPGLLRDDGVTTLRYPGGAFADNYHWSTHKATNSQAPMSLRYSGLAPHSDFGHFVTLLDQIGTTVLTVNYGSNQDGTGGGEPLEAAAWVAYANGNPSDTKIIGKDPSGHDWQTVGYWATLRSSQPLPTDDGKNFLRIAHPQPLNVKYWEVGNEVYQNGYYGGEGPEVDLHAPYPSDVKDNAKSRQKNPKLSPEAYGQALIQFIKAMKAVDARIKVGASLDIPLANTWDTQDYTKDPVTGLYVQHSSFSKSPDSAMDWDRGVLKTAGKDIDFVSLHWNTGGTTEDSNYKNLDNPKLLAAPRDELPKVVGALLDLFQKYCGENTKNMQMLVTSMGPKPYIILTDELVPGLFATDAYLNLMEDGTANIDWTELHKGGFLDEKNKPGSIYFGLQMVHYLMNFNEPVVAASSSHPLLSVHAARHQNGSVTVMLINKDPKNVATVKITVSGAKLASNGMRFDYGKGNQPSDNIIAGNPITDVGNTFTLTVPPYTISDVLIPQAK